MFRDPKQFLLLHIEKVVLVVMLLLLVLVVYVYHPWSMESRDKENVRRLLEDGQRQIDDTRWGVLPPVPPYVQEINSVIERPWPEGQGPYLYPPKKLVFWNLKRGINIVDETVDLAKVLPVKAVYAKADKGQVVVIFQLDDTAERHALEGGVQEYQTGLEFDHIEIQRTDRNTHETTTVTPDGWLPAGLPARYGAPTGADAGRSMLFGVPVYTYAQATSPDEQWRKKMEEEMRQRTEAMQKEQERMQKEQERIRKEQETKTPPGPPTPPKYPTPAPPKYPTPTPTKTTPTPPKYVTPTPPRPAPSRTGKPGVPLSGWYYFVDQNNIDPEGRYEYNVVIYVKNPLYGKTFKGRPASALLNSDAAGTSAGGVQVESFKRWYFQGGTASAQMEMGTFKVRTLVGGRKDFTPDEINDVVGELTGEDGGRAPKKKTSADLEGTWVEQNFTVAPGEEIGRKAVVTVGGEKREIDFGTGCFLVSIQNDIQVVEDRRPVSVPGRDGTIGTVDRITRGVFPKLRIAYMDRKGVLKTKWQEIAPPLAKGTTEK